MNKYTRFWANEPLVLPGEPEHQIRMAEIALNAGIGGELANIEIRHARQAIDLRDNQWQRDWDGPAESN